METSEAFTVPGTIVWTPAAGLSAVDILDPTATPASTTTYTLTGTYNGCSSSDDVVVSVGTSPDLSYTLSGTSPLCSGESTDVILSSSQANVTYQLLLDGTPVGSSIAGTGSSISFGSQSQAGTYTVEVTGGSGFCAGPFTMSSSFTLTLDTPPTAPTSITGTTTITCGQSTALTISGGSDGSGATYEWYTDGCGTGSSIGSTASITVSPTTTTTYYVRRVGSSACTNTTACASVTVTVNPISSPSASGTTICSGSTATLTASGGPAGSTYNWYSDATGTNLVGTGSTFTTPILTSSTTYYLQAQQGTCESAIVSVDVTVDQPPTAPTSLSLIHI